MNYEHISGIGNIPLGINRDIDIRFTKYSVNEISSFTYTPVTSCDVERSFSLYKNFLRSNRQGMTFENIKYCIVAHVDK